MKMKANIGRMKEKVVAVHFKTPFYDTTLIYFYLFSNYYFFFIFIQYTSNRISKLGISSLCGNIRRNPTTKCMQRCI